MHHESMDATLVKEGARMGAGNRVQLSDLPKDAATLLEPLDTDADGFLDRADLAHAAMLLRNEKSQKGSVKKLVVAFGIIALAMIVANFACGVLAVNIVDEHFVKTSVGDPSTALGQSVDKAVLFQNKQGSANLATGSITHIMNLTDPQMTMSAHAPKGFNSYNQIQAVTITRKNGEKLGFQVAGYRWYNASNMDFYLSVGYTVRVQNGQKVLLDGVQLSYVDISGRRLNWLMDDISDIGGEVVSTAEAAGEACLAVGCEVALLA